MDKSETVTEQQEESSVACSSSSGASSLKKTSRKTRQTRSMTRQKQLTQVDSTTNVDSATNVDSTDQIGSEVVEEDILNSIDLTQLGPEQPQKRDRPGKGVKRKKVKEISYLPRANNTSAFEASWSESDKKRLLIALQRFGILEIDQLIKSVPGKSEEDIRKFITIKWKAARTELRAHLKEVKKAKGGNNCYLGPVDKWLEILANFYPNYDHYKTNPIAHAVLLIWKYEKHPDPSECGGIDFKALYEYMYYMLCGYPPKHLNQPTAAFLAETLKNFASRIKSGNWSEILEHLKSPLKVKTPKITPVSEDDVIAALSYPKEKCLEELAKTYGFNPFSIPSNLLKKKRDVPADPAQK